MRFPTSASSAHYQPHMTMLRSISQQNPYFCLSFGSLTPLYGYPGTCAVLDKEAQPWHWREMLSIQTLPSACSFQFFPLQSDSQVAPIGTAIMRITFQVPPGRVVVCLQPSPRAQDVAFKMHCKHTHHLRLQAALACASFSCKVITASDSNCEIHIWSQWALVRCTQWDVFATGLMLPAKKH